MDDRELVATLRDDFGDISFCGGSGDDPDTALAFVRFVQGLGPEYIHPDDVEENVTVDVETKPGWSALALEYVFSDMSAEDHAEVVIAFFATLTAEKRRSAWANVQAQIARANLWSYEAPVLDQLVERSGVPAPEPRPPRPTEPSLDNNPPTPFGWQLMPPSKITPEVAAWASVILEDPVKYPMFSSVSESPLSRFGGILARVEWVVGGSDSQVKRGVTLYEPDAELYR